MIKQPKHSSSSTPLNLIHITHHDSNYTTDEGDYSEILYVYTSMDRFNPAHYGNDEDKIPFVQFVIDEFLEASVLKLLFHAVSTEYDYHDGDDCWTIAIWNDYEYGRSIRIEDRIYQEKKLECKDINFDKWIQEALESAIFI